MRDLFGRRGARPSDGTVQLGEFLHTMRALKAGAMLGADGRRPIGGL